MTRMCKQRARELHKQVLTEPLANTMYHQQTWAKNGRRSGTNGTNWRGEAPQVQALREIVFGGWPSKPALFYSFLLGLLAMIKCGCCSYQCDNRHVSNWRLVVARLHCRRHCVGNARADKTRIGLGQSKNGGFGGQAQAVTPLTAHAAVYQRQGEEQKCFTAGIKKQVKIHQRCWLVGGVLTPGGAAVTSTTMRRHH